MSKINEQWLYREFVQKKKSPETIAKENNLTILDVKAWVSLYQFHKLRSSHNKYAWDS